MLIVCRSKIEGFEDKLVDGRPIRQVPFVELEFFGGMEKGRLFVRKVGERLQHHALEMEKDAKERPAGSSSNSQNVESKQVDTLREGVSDLKMN